jgi:hypothetical protein
MQWPAPGAMSFAASGITAATGFVRIRAAGEATLK